LPPRPSGSRRPNVMASAPASAEPSPPPCRRS
jgi:hypothetical protein